MCSPDQTAADVIPVAIEKIKKVTTQEGQEMLDRPLEDYVLKIVGRSEFVLNPTTPLHKLVYVREFVNRWQKLEFIITFREELKELEDSHDRALVAAEELVERVQEKVYPMYEVDSLFLMRGLGGGKKRECLNFFKFFLSPFSCECDSFSRL